MLRCFSPLFLPDHQKSPHLCRRSPRDHFQGCIVKQVAMICSKYRVFVPFFILLAVPLFGQRLTISRIDTSGYPTVRGYVYALDAAGNSIAGLSAGDFSVAENGSPRSIVSMNCPSPHPVNGLSSV